MMRSRNIITVVNHVIKVSKQGLAGADASPGSIYMWGFMGLTPDSFVELFNAAREF